MRIGNRRLIADWGHLAFLVAVTALTTMYMIHVLDVSRNLNNTILVVPVAVILLVIALFVLFGALRLERDGESQPEAQVEPDAEEADSGEYVQTRGDILRSFVLMVGMGAFVWLYPKLGLDLATFLFIFGALWLLGMRRPVFTLLYSAIFTLVVVGGAHWLLPYPMPLLL